MTWFCIPSKRAPSEALAALDKWREQGYRIALWRDLGDDPVDCDLLIQREAYPGYARAVNALAAAVLENDPRCEWIVTGGDDTDPDPNHTAEEIARQCTEYFGGTFGVMQPTGDRFASGSIDRIAGSPWLGREWCQRANGGEGPFWPEFTHMFGDECLLRTAERLGVYWRRPDLIHLHRHFMRASDAIDAPAVIKAVPPHLREWNEQRHWNTSKAIFKGLEAQNFEPCLPL